GSHRLVQEQYLRLTRERARERDALPLAAGKLGRLRTREVLDAQPPQQPIRIPSAEDDVLLHREAREERVLLEDEADGPPLGSPVDPACLVEPGVAAGADRSASGPREPSDCTQERRLARAGGTDECDRLRPDLER